MTTPQDNEWEIEVLQNRYKEMFGIEISKVQAEQIFLFEDEKRRGSAKYFFSVWEDWDYEWASLKKILTDEQFTLFEKHYQEGLETYRLQLINEDENCLNEIAFLKEKIKYYEEQFLPGLFKDLYFSSLLQLSGEKAKIDFLKAEYKNYLNDSKKKILSNHFRQYRTYKPNELEVSLLRHKLSYLFPNYLSFKSNMDEPTLVVGDYLKQKFKFLQEKYDYLIQEKLETLKQFNDELFKIYHPERQSGWHVTIAPLSTEEEKEIRIVSYLLLDKGKYGC